MSMKPTDFAALLTSYLSSYLPGQCNVSKNTVMSYRDTFSLLLSYLKDKENLPPERLRLSDLSRARMEAFLSWLETERNNSISTRNQRLAALHAFFRYAQIESPENLLDCQKALSIRFKRCEKPKVDYLKETDLQFLLSLPDTALPRGRRDLILLCLLYDSGARVQELADLRVRDVRLEEPAIISLFGKGRKMRHIPILSNTKQLLSRYLAENKLTTHEKTDNPLFFNSQKSKLTRAGIAYIIGKYVKQAKEANPSFPNTVSPHVLRHTKAMHLFTAGVNLIYIRDLLGHSDVATTEIYARADTEMKRAALLKLYPADETDEKPNWQANSGLMDWLQNLCK